MPSYVPRVIDGWSALRIRSSTPAAGRPVDIGQLGPDNLLGPEADLGGGPLGV